MKRHDVRIQGFTRSVLGGLLLVVIAGAAEAQQWNTSGTNISNANSGNVGVGTSAPAYKLDVTPNFRLNNDGTGHVFNWYPAITSSGTNYYKAFDINGYQLPIAAGVTESGYRIGLGVQGFVSDANFAGTLQYQFGIWARHGSHVATSGSRINYSYGVFIDSLTGGATQIDNLYGLYQASPEAKNYFAGSVGIGTTSSESILDIESPSDKYAKFGSVPWSLRLGALQAGQQFISLGVKKTAADNNYVAATGNNSAVAHVIQEFDYSSGINFLGQSHVADGTTLNPTNIAHFDINGNVGIGTTTPNSKLQVAGHVWADGVITSNSEPQYGAGSQLRSWGLNKDDSNMYIEFGSAASHALYITDHWRYTSPIALMAGNVGVGTANPSQKLQIGDNSTASLGLRIAATGVNWDQTTDANGDLNIGNGNGSYLKLTRTSITSSFAGNVTVAGSINAKYQDVAEWVASSEQFSAGTVVVLDSTKSNQVTSSSVSYDTRVAGVVSEQPGIALGEQSEGKVLVATTGRVRVKVDASKGPIHVGDLLVTSDIPGIAMKSEPMEINGRKFHQPGTLIGKALEPLEKGKGAILVLLSLQ